MAGAGKSDGQPAARPPRRVSPFVVAAAAVGAVVAFIGTPLLLRAFVIEAFQIPSGAMTPALIVGDHMFTSKWSQAVRRGDVVVFRYPPDPTTDYVKRVIGLAGDEIRVTSNVVVLNGRPAARRLINKECPEGMADASPQVDSCEQWEEILDGRAFTVVQMGGLVGSNFGPVVVPEGHVFVMGDNRDNSSDSRVWGPVPLPNVKAHALWIWWSRGPNGARWNRVGRSVR